MNGVTSVLVTQGGFVAPLRPNMSPATKKETKHVDRPRSTPRLGWVSSGGWVRPILFCLRHCAITLPIVLVFVSFGVTTRASMQLHFLLFAAVCTLPRGPIRPGFQPDRKENGTPNMTSTFVHEIARPHIFNNSWCELSQQGWAIWIYITSFAGRAPLSTVACFIRSNVRFTQF